LVVRARREVCKGAGLLVLRDENAVLRGRIGRVGYRPGDRRWLAALSRRIPRRRWGEVFAVTPAALLAWHRRLAAGNWDDARRRRSAAAAIRTLVIRMAAGNPAGGHRRGHGELIKPGHRIAASTVRQIRPDARTGPAGRRLLTGHGRGVLAAGFVHAGTVPLRRIYALIVTGHGTPPRSPGRLHRAPRRFLDNTGSAQFPDGPRPARRFCQVPDRGSCRAVHRLLRRRLPRGRRQDSPQPAAGAQGERRLRTDDRHRAPRALRLAADRRRASSAPGTGRNTCSATTPPGRTAPWASCRRLTLTADRRRLALLSTGSAESRPASGLTMTISSLPDRRWAISESGRSIVIAAFVSSSPSGDGGSTDGQAVDLMRLTGASASR
jgi:hypothetical protein